MGIGANTAIFTVDYATLLAPLPYPQPDQIVVVWSKIQGFHNSISAGDFADWKRMNSSFSDLIAITGASFNIASKDQLENVDGTQVTPRAYRMLGQPFFMGRDFLPEEGAEGKSHVVILTHKLWEHLGANPNIIGTNLRIDGEPYTVVGVLLPGLDDRSRSQLTVPLVFKPEQTLSLVVKEAFQVVHTTSQTVQATSKIVSEMAASIDTLGRIAASHEHRLDHLEGQ